MKTTDIVDQQNIRTDIPEFGPGDELKVHVRVVESGKERIQVFQGNVIGRHGSGVQETYTVRKVSYGVVSSAPSRCTPRRGQDRVVKKATCVAPSCITCATAPVRPPRSAKSATSDPWVEDPSVERRRSRGFRGGSRTPSRAGVSGRCGHVPLRHRNRAPLLSRELGRTEGLR